MTYSVVVPVYNRASTLDRALDSVRSQTVAPAEIILVDDRSTDGSWAAMQAIAQADARVKILRHDRNQGAPAARNHGAALASQPLIAFLDSDDVWKPTKCARQIALLAAHPESPAAFSNVEYWYGKARPRPGRVPAVVPLQGLYDYNRLGGTSSVLVRRAAFEQVGGFLIDMPACQDWELWLRLAKLGPLVAVPEILVEYHFDGGGRISKNRDRVEQGHARIFAAVRADIADPVALRRVTAAQALRLAAVYTKQFDDRRGALALAARGLRLHPSATNLARAGKVVINLARNVVRPPR